MTPSPTICRVAIVSLNWNAGHRTETWLESLCRLNYPKEQIRIYIRDNASSDDSVPRIAKAIADNKDRLPEVFLLEGKDHPGVTAAFNELTALVPPDYNVVIRVDNDIELHPDAIRELVAGIEADANNGIAGPMVLYAAERSLLNSGAISINWYGGRHRNISPESTVRCDVVLGCVMACKRELLNKLDYWFRPEFFFFAEEPDLCERARALGYATIYVPSAIAYHDTRISSARHPALSAFLNIRNHIRVHAEYGPLFAYPIYLARLLAGVARRAFLRGDVAEVRGFFHGVMNRPINPLEWEAEMKKVGQIIHKNREGLAQ